MIWIPVIYVCATACLFLVGDPEYSESKCMAKLASAAVELEKQEGVQAFDGTCIPVRSA
jgi:hypothetical protein